ncbi:hypothetical protein RJ640_025324 [Escallonia rubra]|uniref:FAR1 domain-containing protein n=1 Tax=Escallonia rubra TaxID=112253 RepID=A0AA88QTR3_9ASTE|nr:hypothetical protein RJ640_025324 [Escallonia rubra]
MLGRFYTASEEQGGASDIDSPSSHDSQKSITVIALTRCAVDLDQGDGEKGGPTEGNMDVSKGDSVLEPRVGMEFESEDAARKFYIEYARRVGFVVRIMQRRRSEIDGKTLARRLGCNKQGFSPNPKSTLGPDKKPRPSAREGCKATILVKMEKSGKWVVTRFVKDHNHPLVVMEHEFSNAGDKDKKIEELTLELQRQDQLCAAYREKLLRFLNNVEEQAEQLSSKVQLVVENVRKVEAEVQSSKVTVGSENERKVEAEVPSYKVTVGSENYGFKWINNFQSLVTVNLDTRPWIVAGSAEKEVPACGESAILEPSVGMEFNSEDAARDFYDEYARRVGFVMRIDQCRRSEVDKRILSRRLSCNKQGYYVKTRDQFGPVRKARASTREGCNAMMLAKVNKSGKWVVTRCVKDHTHPLVISDHPFRNAMDSKDRRIQELTTELERQDQLCALYRGQLITFLKNVEEQTELLSTKIQIAVDNDQMESTSGQAFSSDESESCLPIGSFIDHDFVSDKGIDVSVDEDAKTMEHSTGSLDSMENVEPLIGMEFNSRDDAREFYASYGRQTGFTVRIHHNRRSRINNMVIGQDFVCSKEGFREKKYVYRKDRVLPPPALTREGCHAMLRVALKDGCKWVITKFVKDHNHTLLSPSKVPWRGSGKNSIGQDEKDQRIRELTLELYNERQRCKRRCTAYQEQLSVVLRFVEEHTDHISRSIEDVVRNVRELENEQLEDSD